MQPALISRHRDDLPSALNWETCVLSAPRVYVSTAAVSKLMARPRCGTREPASPLRDSTISTCRSRSRPNISPPPNTGNLREQLHQYLLRLILPHPTQRHPSRRSYTWCSPFQVGRHSLLKYLLWVVTTFCNDFSSIDYFAFRFWEVKIVA